MSQNETTQPMAEKLRWWLAIIVILAGISGSLYYVDELPAILRALMVIGGVIFGALIGYTTPKGKEFSRFVKQANIERQKIVWPTKNETLHTTLMVLVVVVIVSIFLFFVDAVFSNLVEYFFSR